MLLDEHIKRAAEEILEKTSSSFSTTAEILKRLTRLDLMQPNVSRAARIKNFETWKQYRRMALDNCEPSQSNEGPYGLRVKDLISLNDAIRRVENNPLALRYLKRK